MKATVFETLIARLLRWPDRARVGVVVLADIVVCIVATALSFVLRVGEIFIAPLPFLYLAALTTFCWLVLATLFQVYRNMMRYFGWNGIERIAKACAGVALVLALVLFVRRPDDVPRTLSFIVPLVLFLLLTINRALISFILMRTSRWRIGIGRKQQTILIYGAGHSALQIADSMRLDPSLVLLGFVDPREEHGGRNFGNQRIFNDSDLEQVLLENSVDSIFIASQSLSRSSRLSLVERIKQIDPRITVKVLPSVAQYATGDVSVSDLKPIAIENLLGRDPVRPKPHLMAPIRGARLMVTGAGGSIGSELSRQIVEQEPAELVLVDKSEYGLFSIEQELLEGLRKSGRSSAVVAVLCDIADARSAQHLFEQWRPQRVFHAAAYKHVPMLETNVVAGVANNVRSTLNVIEGCDAVGSEMLTLVSSDKAVRPTSVMGASKRFCELLVQARATRGGGRTRHCAVRFGNVLGSSGSVVPKFERQIASGGPITLTHRDITRFFMTIPEAASLVLQASAMGKAGEIFLLDMGEPIRIADLARTMVELSGLSVRDAAHPDGDIEIRETGLRPGEKLYEELLVDADAERTEHDRIIMGEDSALGEREMARHVAAIQRAFDAHDEEAVLAVLSAAVTGFRERAARRNVA